MQKTLAKMQKILYNVREVFKVIKNMIKDRRLELGLTMKEVAKAVGVSEGTISRWESGEISNMKRSRIASLAKILKLQPSDLVLGNVSEGITEDTSDIDREFKKLLSDMSEQDKEWLLNVIKSVIDGRK